MSKKDDRITDLENELMVAYDTEDILCAENYDLTLAIQALEVKVRDLETELEIQSIPLVTNVYTETTKVAVPFAVTVGNAIDSWIEKVKREWSNFK